MSHVFIRYSRSDREYVDTLADHLRKAGLTPWLDDGIATGERFERVIAERVDACAALIIVMTPGSNRQDLWMGDLELAAAPAVSRLVGGAESARFEIVEPAPVALSEPGLVVPRRVSFTLPVEK